MAVILTETFEVQRSEQIANDEENAEAKRIAERLGLKEQVEVRTPKGAVPPYKPLNGTLKRVIEMVAPQRTPLSQYKCLIPLRVMQVAEQASSVADMSLVVQHENGARLLDPVAFAETYLVLAGKEASWLVARWGTELADWAELDKRARAVYKAKLLAELADVRKEVERDAENADSFVAKFFSGDRHVYAYYDGMPHYSIQV